MNHKYKWLFEQCAFISGSKISVKNFISTFENSKYCNAKEEVSDILRQSGCKYDGYKNDIAVVGLPAIAVSENGEVMLVVGKNKSGGFKVRTEVDAFDVFSFEPGTHFVEVSKQEDVSSVASVFGLFRAATLSQKNIFINAALASLIINIIALAASFYSMQVYDRVIPMQGLSTLFALTIGVMMVNRHHLSRHFFQNLSSYSNLPHYATFLTSFLIPSR